MERDDIIEYSLDVKHSEEEGIKIRKRLWGVFWLLLAVTVFEVIIGAWWHSLGLSWTAIKVSFIMLTAVKAGFIVMVFMHLWDELKFLRYIILIPYCSFIIYLLFICFMEALHVKSADMLLL